MPITLNGDTGITTPTYNGTDTSEYLVPVTAFKNRLINSDMRIDQRNAGASVTVANNSTPYTLDRWRAVRFNDSTGTYTVARSSTAPAGFTNSAIVTTSAAQSSVPSNGLYRFEQAVEGFNVADLGWGTSNAQTVTLSFWVRSSLTGTFGGRVSNGDENRSYVIQFTINSANTWEQKSITIQGDTTGTWSTNNGIGLWLVFDIGSGANYDGTANTWNAANVIRASGNVRLINTLNATLNITGVQLEKGSTATSFDYRPYGTELALCQRYYQKSFNMDVAPANNTTDNIHYVSASYATNVTDGERITYTTEMRASPTVALYSTTGATGVWAAFTGTWVDMTTTAANRQNEKGFTPRLTRTSTFAATGAYGIRGNWTADAEL